MRFVQLNTGWANPPVVDLDRVMSVQWFTLKESEKNDDGHTIMVERGSLEIGFFGREEASTFRCKTLDDAKSTYSEIAYLLEATDMVEARKRQTDKESIKNG